MNELEKLQLEEIIRKRNSDRAVGIILVCGIVMFWGFGVLIMITEYLSKILA